MNFMFGLVLLLALTGAPGTSAASSIVMKFPDVALKQGERIVSMTIQFKDAHVRSINNIPKDWGMTLDLDIQPRPRVSGHCRHGAGALFSSTELPEFVVEPLDTSTTELVGRATLGTVNFASEASRNIKVDVKGSIP